MLTNHLSVSDARRAHPNTQAPEKTVTSVALPARGLKKSVLAHEVDTSPRTKDVPPPKFAVGFLLMDSSLNLISSNVEATQILSYPDKLRNLKRQELFVTGKIRSTLMSQEPLGESPFVAEFRSGRRRYFCRAFRIDSQASSKEIANRMNVSPNTVKAFLRLIMTKMGVSSRSEVMRKIIMTQPQY